MSGIDYLNYIYCDLHMSEEVMHSAHPSDDKKTKVEKYMNRLDKVRSNSNTDARKQRLKKLCYAIYVIKEEDIHGSINKEDVINDQKESLDSWLDYLLDDDSKYPMWARYWAFRGMLKIGTYDAEKDTYQTRSKKTITPFIEANKEVITNCIELVLKYTNGEEIEDKTLKKLIKNGSFQKLYILYTKKIKEKYKSYGTDGCWVKYSYQDINEVEQKEKNGIKPEYLKMYESIKGYSTDWCTAKSKKLACDQISGSHGYIGGDFYVYYTSNENGEYKIPRIAIRMDKDKIGEIRGVGAAQNLEEGLEDIVIDKLLTLTDVTSLRIEKNIKIAEDCKLLTIISNKLDNDLELSEDEIEFILEINRPIKKFGRASDLRVEKCKRKIVSKLTDKNLVIKAIKQDGSIFKFVNYKLKEDKLVALHALKKEGENFKYISKKLQSDEELVLLAIKGYPEAIIHTPLSIDKEFILKAACINPEILKHIDVSETLALELVNENGHSIRYLKQFQDNMKVVLEAMNHYEKAYMYASENLKNDPDFINYVNCLTVNHINKEKKKIK